MNESIQLANISFVNNYCKYPESDTDVKKTAKHTAYVLATVLGISLNIFVIVLAAKFTVRRNLHHLIINMAVSDALYLLMRFLYSLPDFIWRIYPKGLLGTICCKTFVFLIFSSATVSLHTLLVISFERFRITSRIRLQRPYTLKKRLLIIAVCWLISTPFAVFYATETLLTKDGRRACVLGRNAHEVLAIIVNISYYTIITINWCLIFFLGIQTTRRLAKPQAIQNHLSDVQRHERARRTLAAVRMVLASMLLYTLCWMPCFVYVVLDWVNFIIPSANILLGCFDWSSFIFIIYKMLPVINSTFSPCIYIIFLSDFRQAAKKVCRKYLNRKKGEFSLN